MLECTHKHRTELVCPNLNPKACCIPLALILQGGIRCFFTSQIPKPYPVMHTLSLFIDGSVCWKVKSLCPLSCGWLSFDLYPWRESPTNSSEGFPWPADFRYNFCFKTTCQKTPSLEIKYNCFNFGPSKGQGLCSSSCSHNRVT